MPTTPSATSVHDGAPAGVAHSIEHHIDRSRAYAAQGKVRLALLAIWAADVEALQALLWESGLGSAPDPDAQLTAVAAAVDESLRARLGDPATPAGDARSLVLRARTALTATFDESVHAMLEERFAALDHLECPLPPPGAAVESRDARLAGRSAPELVTDLRMAAGDCMAVAAGLASAGLPREAVRQARLADLASFEAYLVTAALAVGDATLATVDLRWDDALAALDVVEETPGDLGEAIQAVRDVLLHSVGPAEVGALRSTFEPVAAVSA